jgi:hypothetical protein
MKRVLFRILVLGLGTIVLLAQTDSFAARGGGGRGGGGGGGRAVSRGGGGGASRGGGMGGGGRGGGSSSRPSVSGGGQTKNVSRPSSNRAGGLAPNKNVAGGNINRSQVSSKIQSRPKGSGSALPSVAQGNRPGTGAGANRGFPNVADKTGGGQITGRAQGVRGSELGAVAGGAVVGAGLANIGGGDSGGRGDLSGRGDFSPERNQAIANRLQYWDKWSGANQGKLADLRTNRGKDWSNINNFRKNENVAG